MCQNEEHFFFSIPAPPPPDAAGGVPHSHSPASRPTHSHSPTAPAVAHTTAHGPRGWRHNAAAWAIAAHRCYAPGSRPSAGALQQQMEETEALYKNTVAELQAECENYRCAPRLPPPPCPPCRALPGAPATSNVLRLLLRYTFYLRCSREWTGTGGLRGGGSIGDGGGGGGV